MLDERNEFHDYIGVVNYTARNKQDTTYLGRFTFDTIQPTDISIIFIHFPSILMEIYRITFLISTI